MRLIDADALPKCNGVFSAAVIENAIKNAPTVDAVPVVRCRDCKHGYPFVNAQYYCIIIDDHTNKVEIHDPDYYCKDGEKRETD